MGIMSKDYHASNRAMWEIGGIWASTFQGLPMRKKGPSLLKPVAPEPLKQVEIRDEITPETPAARISRQRLMTWDNFVRPVSRPPEKRTLRHGNRADRHVPLVERHAGESGEVDIGCTRRD